MKVRVRSFWHKDPVLFLSGLLAFLSLLLVPPDRAYAGYLDFKVLICLFALMLAVELLREAGWLDVTAKHVLRRAGWTAHRSGNNGHVWASVNGISDASMINTQLTAAGINVYELNVVQPTLEDIFLQVTGEEAGLLQRTPWSAKSRAYCARKD